MDGTPKKRGRKPKNKTVTKHNANFSVNPTNDNLIVTIPKKSEESKESEIQGYEEHSVGSELDETCRGSCCWNCSGDIVNRVSVPLMYKGGVFYLYGSFCSFGCGCRYLFENYANKDLWEKYTLMNLYYNRVNKTIGEKVPINPSRLRLQKFGGDMTMEDYHQMDHIANPSDIMLAPIFPINHSVYDYDAKVKISDTSDLKLYRKKPLKQHQNIFGTMKIS